MNDIQKYFVSLLSSYLNNEIPEANTICKWSEIFKLAELHNLTGVIALEINKLAPENQPNSTGKSYFNQALGLTVQNTELKNIGVKKMTEVLSAAEINHVIIKGSAIRHLYPVPDVRTSGDTDIVISEDDKQKVKEYLIDAGFELIHESVTQLVFRYLEQEFQFKTYFDCMNTEDRAFFSIDLCETENGFTYYLKPLLHLLYVINHLLKHIKSGGVGLRQLMDIDVLLRNEEIDINQLIWLCSNMGIEKSAKAIIALTKRLFSTPVDLECTIDDELFDQLTDVIITGGVFGFANANEGTVRLANSGSKIKAIMSTLFATKEYMYNTYIYANKHHCLLPIAYIQRFISAIFKRRKQNTENIKSIFKDDEKAIKLSNIQKELEI